MIFTLNVTEETFGQVFSHPIDYSKNMEHSLSASFSSTSKILMY